VLGCSGTGFSTLPPKHWITDRGERRLADAKVKQALLRVLMHTVQHRRSKCRGQSGSDPCRQVYDGASRQRLSCYCGMPATDIRWAATS
jgi:hypothetical protein